MALRAERGGKVPARVRWKLRPPTADVTPRTAEDSIFRSYALDSYGRHNPGKIGSGPNTELRYSSTGFAEIETLQDPDTGGR